MNAIDAVRRAGVVGAGGAGFPSHVKLAAAAEIVIANGAECEPLIHKDAQLMERHAAGVLAGLEAVMQATGAERGIIGLKIKHSGAIAAFEPLLHGKPIELHVLGDFYPTGDEFVLVYEATGRLVPPGGIPLQVGVVVQNVESLYNIALALEGKPVTHKYLTVAGAVDRPLTCRVPVGTRFGELLALAGVSGDSAPALFVGGTMMGRLSRDLDECVSKTTGGLIVLPGEHPLVRRLERPEEAMHQIGKSACDQCSYCTELCPRYLLGYQIEPHKVMRGLVFSTAGEDFWNSWGMLCCECGLCTLYACPEDLYPREACQRAKQALHAKRFEWKGEKTAPVKPHPMYESRRMPLKNLVQRLGLVPYDVEAPYVELDTVPAQVRLALKQHAGEAARALVATGQRVAVGAVVADVDVGELGAAIHASIDGVVEAVDGEIVIAAC